MTQTAIDPTDPLSEPSHSAQHNGTTNAIANLMTRMDGVEADVGAQSGEVEQARLAAHEWVIRGPVVKSDNFLLPVLWNLTGRSVQYVAAKLTVYTPPVGTSIKVNIVTGPNVGDGHYDPGQQMTTILVTELEIPEGAYESDFYYGPPSGNDFVGEMAVENFLAAYVTQTGDGADPGYDLTIQLNRLL